MFKIFAACVFVAALLSPASSLYGQVGYSATKPFSTYVYAAADAADNEQGYGKALGGSGGVILRHTQWIGLDARGVIMNARVPLHTFVGEAGPRVAPRYWRLTPYGELLFGIAHTGYRQPDGTQGSGFGPVITYDFGVDLRITRLIQWRVAEYSRGHIFTGPGVNPTIASTGIVFRLN